MHKKIILNNNDIDLFNLIKVIWYRKLLIILVIFLSLIVSIGTITYNKYKTNFKTYNFETIFSINLFTDSELLYFERINGLIKSSNELNYNLNREKMLKITIDKILNLDFNRSFIKKNIYFQNRMSKSNKDEFNLQLNNYTKLFVLEGNGNNYKLKFYWDNQFESQKILEDYLNYLSVDLKNETIEKFNYILLRLKEIQNKKYKMQMDYLISQSDIATKMGIEYPIRLFFDPQLSVYDFTYLHGYLAINAQIEKLKKLKNIELEFLNDEINNIQNNQNINWVNYFLISSLEKKVDDKNINIIIISIILGLIIGIILALILNSVKFKKKT